MKENLGRNSHDTASLKGAFHKIFDFSLFSGILLNLDQRLCATEILNMFSTSIRITSRNRSHFDIA